METRVERDLHMRLVLSPERSVRVPARLSYRSGDPFAVHMTFHVGSAAPVSWVFARELLAEGVRRPCGYGDVRVWPARVRGGTAVCLALNSPDGNALLQAPAAGVEAWLARTALVRGPSERERGLELDAELARLLSERTDQADQ